MLGADGVASGCGPACAGAASSKAGMQAGKKAVQRVAWADMSDSHDAAQYACNLQFEQCLRLRTIAHQE
eukprot:4594641-Alexandrium_andersonii.AAC.1